MPNKSSGFLLEDSGCGYSVYQSIKHFFNRRLCSGLPRLPTKKKCTNCSLVNFPDALSCARCEADLIETVNCRDSKTERAAILLHEAEHLQGKKEHDAYEFVWKHRKQLGWTSDEYLGSPVRQNIRRQTRDNAPDQ